LARRLELDFADVYAGPFNMGGLSGFPFGGLTSFRAMAAHIPDQGSCLVVYGPHIGIDSQGEVGTVERRGRKHSGACCGSATAASHYVLDVFKHREDPSADNKNLIDVLDVLKHGEDPSAATNNLIDAQQDMVSHLLLPHAQRLADAQDARVELPLALFDAQKPLIESIVWKGASHVAAPGYIALVGGVQINTPPDLSDYFLTFQFDVYNNRFEKVDDLLWED
jgi:hypothetical protein